MRHLVVVVLLSVLAACTSVQVRPVGGDIDLEHVCIVRNPDVLVQDFIDVLRDGFSRHNVTTSVVSKDEAGSCETTLTYTALRSWDITPYLSHAELRLWRDGSQIGYAEYHLKGKGGFALTKFQGTKDKMDPVIDQLLQGRR